MFVDQDGDSPEIGSADMIAIEPPLVMTEITEVQRFPRRHAVFRLPLSIDPASNGVHQLAFPQVVGALQHNSGQYKPLGCA